MGDLGADAVMTLTSKISRPARSAVSLGTVAAKILGSSLSFVSRLAAAAAVLLLRRERTVTAQTRYATVVANKISNPLLFSLSLAIQLFVTTPAAAQVLPTTAVGRTPGQFGVSHSGAATYTIPLWTPPGIAGVEPELALAYNSQSGGAFVSLGWSISGMSQITRCQRTWTQDGQPEAVLLSAADRFCIDGRRLRGHTGTYGQPNSSYQTEIADFSFVTAKGTSGAGPAWFEVEAKSGLIYEYGNSSSSRAVLPATGTPHAWGLSKVRDRLGNSMVITYVSSSGTLAPVEIQYTQTPTTGATYAYSVLFSYSTLDPSDQTTGYLAGSPYAASSQLSTVQIRQAGSGGTLLRIYRLNYSDSPTTGRSRLASVQECAGASGSDCLAPTTISYQGDQAGVLNPTAMAVSVSGAAAVSLVDINDDGCTDILLATLSGANVNWSARMCLPGFGTGVFREAISTGIVTLQNDDILFDHFTGSGQPGLLAPSSGVWNLYRFNGTPSLGSFASVSTGLAVDANRLPAPNPADGRWPSFASADVDGDGLPDMVWAATYNGLQSIYTRRNTTSPGGVLSFSPQMVEAYPIPGLPYHFAGIFGNNSAQSPDVQGIDFNADGRDDVVMGLWTGSTTLISGTARQLISGGGTFYTGAAIQNHLGSPRALNFNNDACTDLAASEIYVSACNGNTGHTVATNGRALIDWDADGRTDVLSPVGSQWYVFRSTGISTEPPAPTGIPYPGAPSLSPVKHGREGLTDLLHLSGGTVHIGLHRGPPPDLVNEITDAFGNKFVPTYGNLATGARGAYSETLSGVATPIFPHAFFRGSLNLVMSFLVYDGKGSVYSNGITYSSARKHLQGRGFLGFAARRIYDSRNGLFRHETYRTDFPYIGALAGQRVTTQQDQTGVIRSLRNVYDTIVLNSTSYNKREFVYLSEAATASYEVGGPFNGAHVQTRITKNTFDSWGTLTDQVVTSYEVGTGLNAGAVHTERVYLTPGTVMNDVSNWCLGRPGEINYSSSHSLPGGGQITKLKRQTWDATLCRLTSEVTSPGSSQWEVSTGFAYDTFGNVNRITLTPAAGNGQSARTTQIDWGVSGQFPRTLTNAKSQVTSIEWDAQKGVQSSVTDRSNLRTEWQHDSFGRLTSERRPDGSSTQFLLSTCSAGNSYCGGASDLRYSVQATPRDTSNNILRTDTQSFDGLDRLRYDSEQLLSGAMSTAITVYDQMGRVASQSEPATSGDPVWYTSFTYDKRDRPTTIERQTSEADASLTTTQFSYQGLSVVKTDPLLRTSSVTYDAVGRIAQTVNAAGSDTDYEYDALGNLVKVRDVYGNETTASFNTEGMRLSSSDPDMGMWTYTYYPLGELKTQTTARGHTTTFTYDALSRPLSRVEPEGTTTWIWDSATNGVGQLHSVQSPGPYSETFGYDTVGRPTQKTVVADGASYVFNQTYSTTTGLLDTLTYPTSTAGVRLKLRYGYQYAQLQTVRDYTGNVLGTTYWRANATNARGQIIDEQLGNGLRTVSGYDRIAGWLDYRTTGPGGGSARQNLEYAWNKVGKLTERRDLNVNHAETFYYDALDRIDYSQRDGVTNLDMAYDAIGNITSKSGVGSYTYHATKKHAVIAAGSNTYAYDANGNMMTRNGAPITWSSYDLPTVINQADGSYSQFSYGADRARYKHATFASTPGVETTIHIGDLFERVTGGGATEYKHYIKAPGGSVAINNRKSTGTTEVTYLLKDHLGSAQMITNSGGGQLALLSNDAFGVRRNGGSWAGTPAVSEWTAINGATHRAFTGHEQLDNLRLIHMGGRVYDPFIGRFLSADPFVQAPFTDQNYNRYSYALNSPLSYTDPSGYNWDDFDFDWDWDLGWEDWFGGDDDDDDSYSSCSPAGSYRCAQVAYTLAIFRSCGLSSACRDRFIARNPRPQPPTPPPTAPDPEDELPPLPDNRAAPAPAPGVPGLGAFGGAAAGRFQGVVDAIPGYSATRDFGAYWADLAESTWNADWPGDGSIEGNLAALPPVIGAPANAVSGIARSVQLGKAGEAAVTAAYNIGSKAQIIVNGRVRVPDGVNLATRVISEVKNTKKLGFTRQLRDYAQYAAENRMRFDLYVRPGARLSPNLRAAEAAGLVNIIPIP